MDAFRIDSHKLMYHPGRVNEWLNGKTICPIYLEIAPSGACNHRCKFCALDYLGYAPNFLETRILKSTLRQAGAMGVKSIMYAGEGEPLLHRDICDIVGFTKGRGIDVAITTNGVLLKKGLSQEILKNLNWIRVSLNAGKSKTYSKVHRAGKKDFEQVLVNLEDAVKIKNKRNLNITIGVQLLLIPDNIKEIFLLARLLKRIGVDYLTIKPYSQHPLSGSRIDKRFGYGGFQNLRKKLDKLEDKDFKIIFRQDTMNRLAAKKDYERCLGVAFWAYIDALGKVYACSAFLGKKEFCYGDIYRQDFKTIINGKRRESVMKRINSSLDVTRCRQACRLDKINSYLWELKNPGKHVNFI